MENLRLGNRHIFKLINYQRAFAGFCGIVAAINGNFGIAAIAILIAMFSIDGRVARL